LLDDIRVWASVVNIDGRDAWRLQVLGDLEWPEWTPQLANDAIRRAIGCDVSYALTSIVPWERRELVVEAFSRGSCFLIGDAAHQLSPTGGYGMNTGIGDAVDLCWKIAAVLDGWGGSRLLDSYDMERRPVAVRNAKRATLNFQRMRSTPSDRFVLEDSERGRNTRFRIGRDVRAAMATEWDSMDVHLGYAYDSSPLICSESFSRSELTCDPCFQSIHPGGRAPHVWLGHHHSILDLFGHGFTLLSFNTEVTADAFVSAATKRGIPLRVECVQDPAAIGIYKFAMVLVRPDGHVAWCGDAPPTDPLAILNKVTGNPAL
jgi:hypothetical protein